MNLKQAMLNLADRFDSELDLFLNNGSICSCTFKRGDSFFAVSFRTHSWPTLPSMKTLEDKIRKHLNEV